MKITRIMEFSLHNEGVWNFTSKTEKNDRGRVEPVRLSTN